MIPTQPPVYYQQNLTKKNEMGIFLGMKADHDFYFISLFTFMNS